MRVDDINILHMVVVTIPIGFLVRWTKAIIGETMCCAQRATILRNHPQLDLGFGDELKDRFATFTDNLGRDYIVTNLMKGIVASETILPLFALGKYVRQGRGLLGVEVGVPTRFLRRLLPNAIITSLIVSRLKKRQIDLTAIRSPESLKW